jgi:hypothetical protein
MKIRANELVPGDVVRGVHTGCKFDPWPRTYVISCEHIKFIDGEVLIECCGLNHYGYSKFNAHDYEVFEIIR